MPLITGSDQSNTPFTPNAGDFIVQVRGRAQLQRENASGAGFVDVKDGLIENKSVIVDNPVAGARYRWTEVWASTAVRADQ